MESSLNPKIKLLHKWTIWTVLMPYYCDAFDAFLMLKNFSKSSRKTLINNFNAFYNSMYQYRKVIAIKDEDNKCLVEDKIVKLMNYPIMLLKLEFEIDRFDAFVAVLDFEKYTRGLIKKYPDDCKADFQPIDIQFLKTDTQLGDLWIRCHLLRRVRSQKHLYDLSQSFLSHL